MHFTFDNQRPIYLQLLEQFQLEIISGRLSPGEKLPSVRELATTARANPNTVQKALTELEDQGLIFTERTNGKFVTQDQKLIHHYRAHIVRDKTRKYIHDLHELGLNNREIIDYFTTKGVKKW